MNRLFFSGKIAMFGLASLLSHVTSHAEETVVFIIDTGQQALLQAEVTPDWFGLDLGERWSHLQVKDQLGNPVPFRFVQKKPVPDLIADDIALPVFLLTTNETPTNTSLPPAMIRVTPNSIEVRTEAAQQTGANSTTEYLIDLRDIEQRPSQLRFNWQGDESNRIYSLNVYYGNDLQHWQHAGRFALTRLLANDTMLEKNHLDLPAQAATHDYLKVQFEPESPIVLNSIIGHHQRYQQTKSATMAWTVNGHAADHQVRATSSRQRRRDDVPVTAWEYPRQERAPANTVFIDFGQRGFIGDLRLLSKNENDQDWREVFNGTWHHIRHQEQWYSSSAIALSQGSARHWRIEVDDSEATAHPPSLRFHAPRWQFQFLANGHSPYLLIRTDDANHRSISAMQEIFDSLDIGSDAPATTVQVQAQVAAITAPEEAPRNLRHIILWSLLIGASVIMLYAVFRLFRQAPKAD